MRFRPRQPCSRGIRGERSFCSILCHGHAPVSQPVLPCYVLSKWLQGVEQQCGSVWNHTNQETTMFLMNKATGLISFSRHLHDNKKPPELRERDEPRRLMEARKKTGQERCQRGDGLIVALRWCNKGNTWMCALIFSMFVQELKHFLLSNTPEIPKLCN